MKRNNESIFLLRVSFIFHWFCFMHNPPLWRMDTSFSSTNMMNVWESEFRKCSFLPWIFSKILIRRIGVEKRRGNTWTAGVRAESIKERRNSVCKYLTCFKLPSTVWERLETNYRNIGRCSWWWQQLHV